MLGALGLVGCGTTQTPGKEEKSFRAPATEMGVRTTTTGQAVTEVDRPLEEIFDIAENELQKEMKLTFVNRSLGKIEAETKKTLFEVAFVVLTTGKVGMIITVTDRDGKKTNGRAARHLADDILRLLKNSPPTAPLARDINNGGEPFDGQTRQRTSADTRPKPD